MKNEEYVLEKIEYLRQIMNQVASDQGLTSSDCIRLSQKLDKLMNEYEQVRKINPINQTLQKHH